MKLIISLILLFTLSTCFGQHRQRLISTDLELMGLSGKVKSLSHLDYDLIENISDTAALRIDHFFLAPNNHTFEFNTAGYLTSKTEYELREDTLKPKGLWRYLYDSLNRITQETYSRNNFSNDTTIWVYEYHGDSVTLIHKYDDTYKHMIYRYAQRNNIEYLTTANADSSYLTSLLFAYDKLNRLMRKEEYEDQNTITFIRSWKYKDSLATKPSLDVGISSKHNYGPVIIMNEYDSLQNLVLSKGVGTQKPKLTAYTFDSYGNWIERRTTLPNALIKVSRRRIEYY